jgi:hypothetical protein
MWHLVMEGNRLLTWLEATPLMEPRVEICEHLVEGLLRAVRDKEAGPQVAMAAQDTVRALCCGPM